MHDRRSIGNGIFRIWAPMYKIKALYPCIIISYAPGDLSATLNSCRWILVVHTSRKPCIKFAGNFASRFSSSRKNFMTCGICFQKFNVSCHAAISMDTKGTAQGSTPLHLFVGGSVSLLPAMFIHKAHLSVPGTLYGYGKVAYPPLVAY